MRNLLTAVLGVAALVPLHGQMPTHKPPADDGKAKAEHAIVEAMAQHHMHGTSHLRLTARRSERQGDRERAAAFVAMLRPALERYRDYRVALSHGYEIFFPDVPQGVY